MRLFGRLKLSQQLLLLLLIIPGFLVTSLLYYSALQHIAIRNKPLEQLALSTSLTLSEKTDRNLCERFSDVQAFAHNLTAVQALEQPDSNAILITAFMNAMMTNYVLYDQMMLCDKEGNVVAFNTIDNKGHQLARPVAGSLNVRTQPWFRAAVVVGGPPGGAYYSDFNEDPENNALYGKTSWGMDFSAPVRNEQGEIIGVWRNRASWKEIVQEIRKEAETGLLSDHPHSLILLMDKQGLLIDASDNTLINRLKIGKNNLMSTFDFAYADTYVHPDEYLYGWAESKGIYTYKGNKWKYLTLIPRVKATDFNVYLHSDWTTLLLFSLAILLLATTISLFFVRNFSSRIQKMIASIQKLSRGETEQLSTSQRNDELGKMSDALNTLHQNFNDITTFANAIGQGNLNAVYSPLGERDKLGHALLHMRDNLLKIRQENIKAQWASDHLFKLSELLRQQHSFEEALTKSLSYLAKTIEGRQAVLFLVHQEQQLLIQKAGFALPANYPNETIMWGEGALGQCWKEQAMLRIQQLPEDYVTCIESGLGASRATEILVLPIRFNETTLGVMEFSVFHIMEDYRVEYLEKAGEYLGAFIAHENIRIQQAQETLYR
jgi:methyl-accepting chemotaxis protein